MTPDRHSGTYLVTGASSGIGRAVCERLLADGHEVIGLSRSIDAPRYSQSGFTALACDLTDFASSADTITALLKSGRSLTGAVFCAGAGYFGGLEQLDFQRIRRLLDLNLLSPMQLSKLLVPGFKRQGHGRLIFIGSEAALEGSKNGTAYCASKFGLRGFVQALSAECRQSGVNVSLINPGMVRTAFFESLHFQPGRDDSNAITPELVAESVAYLLGVDANTVVDEINLSPRKRVIEFGQSGASPT